MKTLRNYGLLACTGLALLVMTQGVAENAGAQEKKKESAASGEKKAGAAKEGKESKGRLPQYYGQIGLSAEQREKIYAIQAQYRQQIDDLEKQLEAVKAKQEGEIQAVLSADQKQKLGELTEKVRSKKEGAKKAEENKEEPKAQN
jgi:hypothetical protein